MRHLVTICIPAYNRPDTLAELLASIDCEPCDDVDILIREDASPRQKEIRTVVRSYQAQHPQHLVHYDENETNLGHGANPRAMLRSATGSFCLFLCDDDRLVRGGISVVLSALRQFPETQVATRAYYSFGTTPEPEVHRYFPESREFPPGADSIVTMFRRTAILTGVVLNRDSAVAAETGLYDSTLLYQQYVVGLLMSRGPGLYIGDPIVMVRSGGTPFFGSSKSEPDHVPGTITPGSVIAFMRGMFRVAAAVEKETGLKVRRRIVRDFGNYSYPTMRLQADRPRSVFFRFLAEFLRLGLWTNPLAWAYATSLVVFGGPRCDRLIAAIRSRRRGNTPVIGSFGRGRRVAITGAAPLQEHDGHA